MDKTKYWENRKQGKRGQGEYLRPKFIEKTKDSYPKLGSHLKYIGEKFVLVNRKEARNK